MQGRYKFINIGFKQRDKDYLAWIREQPCLVCRVKSCVPSHRGGGTSMKGPDWAAVPLCWSHHEECHRGAETFAKEHQIEWDEAALCCLIRWEAGK